MAFHNLPPPPPTKNADSALDRWLQLMRDKISAAGAIVWTQITLPTKAANTVLAGPTTGADAQVTFRALVTADLPAGTGTVTSVAQTVPTGFTISGSPITTSGTLALSYAAGYSLPTDASQANWNTAYTDRLKWDGGATDLVAATGRTSLGGTTVGQSYFTLANPSAITFPRMNADNTVSSLNAADFRTAIGAGTGSVTSIDVSGGTTGLTFSGGPITTSGTITLAGTLDADNGGTGQSSYAVGDLLYASTTTALSKLADVSAGSYLRSGGVNTAPLWSTLKLPNAATANYIPYATSTNTWGESANLTFGGSALTLTGTQVISANSATTALRVTQTGAGNAFVVEDSASTDSTPFVIDTNGKVVTGYTAAITALGVVPNNQIIGMNIATGTALMAGFAADATSTGGVYLAKSRGAIGAIGTIVQSGDRLGDFEFLGDDGSALIRGATMRAEVDGTPGLNDMPGRLLFMTTADGASVPTERMRIDSAGNVGIGTSSTLDTKVRIGGTVVYPASGGSSFGLKINGTAGSGGTSNAGGVISIASTEDAAATYSNVYSYYAQQGTVSGGSRIATTNYYGFIVDSTPVNATNNYGFYSNIVAATGRWNFYAAGSANNAYAGNSSFGQVVAPIAAVDTTSFATNLVTNTGATYTVLTTDHTIIQTTAASVYTLPAASSFTGRILHLVTQFAGTVTSASSNVVPIAGGAAGTAILAATAGKFATLQSDGTNWIIIASN